MRSTARFINSALITHSLLAFALFTAMLTTASSAVAEDNRATFEQVSDKFKELVDNGIKELNELKSKKDKLKKLKSLDDEFKKHLKENPNFSDNYFYYVLAPALQLTSLTPNQLNRTKCESTRYTIEYTDQAFAPETSELLPETKRAVELVEALCK